MTLTEPYILKMTPHLVPKIWGGRQLEALFNKDLPDSELYGESWEVADLPEAQSLIANGPLAGEPLHRALQSWKTRLSPKTSTKGRYPLLVKIIDASKDLSIQVHPGGQKAHSMDGADSKDEAWVILSAQPGASILHGVDTAMSKESFRSAIIDGSIVERLRRIPVQPGDLVRVPPGTVHAICAGVVLLEVQEPSDTTFRVYDYLRPGLDGQLRPLHLEQALRVARRDGKHEEHLRRMTPDAPQSQRVQAPSYSIELLRLNPGARHSLKVTGATALVVLEGAIAFDFEGNGSSEERWVRGESAVIPIFAEPVSVQADDHPTCVAICRSK